MGQIIFEKNKKTVDNTSLNLYLTGPHTCSWNVHKFVKTIQPAKLTCTINVVSIFEHKSIIHLEFILVYVTRNEPMLFFFQMVSLLFQHLFLNNSFLSTNLKWHLHDILVCLTRCMATLSMLFHWSFYSSNGKKAIQKAFNIGPKAYFSYLVSSLTHCVHSLLCLSSPCNTKHTFLTPFLTCINHIKEIASPCLQKFYLLPFSPSRKVPGKGGKMVLSAKRQNTGRGRKGDLGSKGILMSLLWDILPTQPRTSSGSSSSGKSWESGCVLRKVYVHQRKTL